MDIKEKFEEFIEGHLGIFEKVIRVFHSVSTSPAITMALTPETLTSATIIAAGVFPLITKLGEEMVKHLLLSEVTDFIKSRFRGSSNKEIEKMVMELSDKQLKELTLEMGEVIKRSMRENTNCEEFILNLSNTIVLNKEFKEQLHKYPELERKIDALKDSLTERLDQIVGKLTKIETNTEELMKESRLSTEQIIKKNKESEERIISAISTERYGPLMEFDVNKIISSALTSEYQSELDQVRDFLLEYRPKEALILLENLRRRSWPSANPLVKFRILTNIGAAKLSLNEQQEASKLFIKALQYNPDDEKALCNAALGYLLLNQMGKARNLTDKVIELNPISCRAYSIRIQSLSENINIEKIIENIPAECKNSTETAYAIGILASKKEKIKDSKKWLEIALKNDKENLPEVKAALGIILLKLVLKEQTVIYTNQLKYTQGDTIGKAIELLSSAWNTISGTALQKYNITWIAYRGLAKEILGDLEGAIEDLEIALDEDSTNSFFIERRAVLAYRCNDNEKAINLLKKIKKVKEIPDSQLILAKILGEDGKYSEAINTVSKLLKYNPSKTIIEDARELLIQLYIDCKDFEEAQKISDSIKSSEPNNIICFVNDAKILSYRGKKEEAIKVLVKTKETVTNSSEFRELLDLANGFYSLEQFNQAAEIYEKITDIATDSLLTRNLINSYYQIGEIGKALEICKTLRKRYGPLQYISEMEVSINEEIGNLSEAKKISKEYLNVYPDTFEMKLRLAGMNLRTNEIEELDSFLNFPIEISDLFLEQGFFLADLYRIRNFKQKFLEVIYEMRRKYYDNSEAHHRYVGNILASRIDIVKSKTIKVDTAVCIEYQSGETKLYILEDRPNPSLARNEINLDNPVAQKLLGKSVRDEVKLKPSVFVKIADIKSKYLYALHDSLYILKNSFPDKEGFEIISLEVPEEGGKLPTELLKIFDKVKSRDVKEKNVKELYIKGMIPIGVFSNLIGENIFDVINALSHDPDLGIQCCHGDSKERGRSILLLKNKPRHVQKSNATNYNNV